MTPDEIYKFHELVQAIQAGKEQASQLRRYSERQIADALASLIKGEREQCASLAEAAAEPSGFGDVQPGDSRRREVALEIAQAIRNRG